MNNVEIPFENGRVRELAEGDLDALISMTNERDIARNYFMFPVSDPTEIWCKYLETQQKERRGGWRKNYVLPIEEGQVVKGLIGMELPWILNNKVQLQYFIGEDYRRKGLAKRAIGAVIPFIFNNLEVRGIYANCVSDNTPSQSLLTNLGFIKYDEIRAKWSPSGSMSYYELVNREKGFNFVF